MVLHGADRRLFPFASTNLAFRPSKPRQSEAGQGPVWIHVADDIDSRPTLLGQDRTKVWTIFPARLNLESSHLPTRRVRKSLGVCPKARLKRRSK